MGFPHRYMVDASVQLVKADGVALAIEAVVEAIAVFHRFDEVLVTVNTPLIRAFNQQIKVGGRNRAPSKFRYEIVKRGWLVREECIANERLECRKASLVAAIEEMKVSGRSFNFPPRKRSQIMSEAHLRSEQQDRWDEPRRDSRLLRETELLVVL